MQGTETIKKQKQRHGRHESAAELCAIAEAAPKLGTAGEKLFATSRLQISKKNFIRLTYLANRLRLSLSALIRAMLELLEEIGGGKTQGRLKKRLLRRIKKADDQPGPRRESAADKWAKDEAGTGRRTRGVEIRLTYKQIGDIAAERDERRIANLKASNSKTLEAMLIIPLMGLESDLRRADAEREANGGAYRERQPKPRQSRNRAYTEAKRRLMGLDGPAKRGRPKGQAETEQGHGLI